jgi:hypothetical protein
MYANLLLGDLGALTPKMPVADIKKKAGKQVRTSKAAAGGDTLGKLPARIVRDTAGIPLQRSGRGNWLGQALCP